MSTKNQISVAIPATVTASVREKLRECKNSAHPYLQGLTIDERKSLFKMGDKTVATVQKSRIM